MKRVFLVLLFLAVSLGALGQQTLLPAPLFHTLVSELCDCQSALEESRPLSMSDTCMTQVSTRYRQELDSARALYLRNAPFLYNEAAHRHGQQLTYMFIDSLVHHCPSFFTVVQDNKYKIFKKEGKPEALKRKIRRLDRQISKNVTAEHVFERSVLLFAVGEDTTALSDVTLLLEDHPSFVQGYLLRGVIREQYEDYAGALLDLQTVHSFYTHSGNYELLLRLYIAALKKKMAVAAGEQP